MVCTDTFLITVYVLVDEFCKQNPALPEEQTVWATGRKSGLSRAEVVALSIFGQWSRFQSERGFWSFCEQRLRPLFPGLPDRAADVARSSGSGLRRSASRWIWRGSSERRRPRTR